LKILLEFFPMTIEGTTFICINDNFQPLSGIKADLNVEYIYFVSRITGKSLIFKSDYFGAITPDNSTEVDHEILTKYFMESNDYYRMEKIKKIKLLVKMRY